MSNEDLDELIRAALDTEPPAEPIARLERFWRDKFRADAWRRWAWRGAAMAATILVVATLLVWQYQQSRLNVARRVPNADSLSPTPPAHAELGTGAPDAAVAIDARGGEDTLSTGRSPTVYERLVFAVQRRDTAEARLPAMAAAVDQLIEATVASSQVNVEQLVSTTGLAAAELEKALLRRLSRSTKDRKLAVLRLLEVCGTSRSTAALLRISRRDAFRDAALTTIERIVGIERLAEMVGQVSDSRLRAAVARRLLISESETGLRGYLSLVRDNDTRALALAVAEELPEPPVTKLLACLDDDDAAVRLSTAVVLGHLNGPEIAKSLVDRVVEDPAAAEAWIALLACRGEYAEGFLSYAMRQPQLLVHVNSARVRWARIVN